MEEEYPPFNSTIFNNPFVDERFKDRRFVYTDNLEQYNELQRNSPSGTFVNYFRNVNPVLKDQQNTVNLVNPIAVASKELELAKAEAQRLKEQGQVEALRRRQDAANQDMQTYRKMLLFNALGPGILRTLTGSAPDPRHDQYRQMYIDSFNKMRALGADAEAADAIAKQNAAAELQLAEQQGNFNQQQILTNAKLNDHVANIDTTFLNAQSKENAAQQNVLNRNAAEMEGYGFLLGEEKFDLQKRQAEEAMAASRAQRKRYESLGTMPWNNLLSSANTLIGDYLGTVDKFRNSGWTDNNWRDADILDSLVDYVPQIASAKRTMNNIYTELRNDAEKRGDYGTVSVLDSDMTRYNMFFDSVLKNSENPDYLKGYIDEPEFDQMVRQTRFGFGFEPQGTFTDPSQSNTDSTSVNPIIAPMSPIERMKGVDLSKSLLDNM